MANGQAQDRHVESLTSNRTHKDREDENNPTLNKKNTFSSPLGHKDHVYSRTRICTGAIIHQSGAARIHSVALAYYAMLLCSKITSLCSSLCSHYAPCHVINHLAKIAELANISYVEGSLSSWLASVPEHSSIVAVDGTTESTSTTLHLLGSCPHLWTS